PADDLDNLRRKADAGAKRAITQFFFDHEHFLRLRDRAAAAGIAIPLIPGILPIENFDRMARFAKACGTQVPGWMADAFANAADADQRTLLATALATEMGDILIAEGAEHLHFYTLNKPDLTFDITRALGVSPQPFAMAGRSGIA
ncbi:MAG: methylenetetrahydrofolate reductase, partial [Pseudomonadota bacterium]